MSTLLVSTVKDPAGGSTITVPTSGTFTLVRGWDLLSSVTPSTASQVDFTGLTSAYTLYMVVMDFLKFATDATHLHARFSQGTTFQTGSGYTDQQVGTGQTSIRLHTTGVGNASGEGMSGRIFLHNPADTNIYTTIRGQFSMWGASTNILTTIGNDGGGYVTDLTAVDGLRLYPAAGTITGGTIRMYGMSLT
jgi:hypothetical protein